MALAPTSGATMATGPWPHTGHHGPMATMAIS